MEKKAKTTTKTPAKTVSAESAKRPKGGMKEKTRVRAGAKIKL